MKVVIYSFSMKRGYPPLHDEHGGGHAFDCRALPNPGRLDEYKTLSGLDRPVIEYLENQESVADFYETTSALVGNSVKEFQRRNFDFLSVAYGCTGGQHRSVYCAEKLAGELGAIDGIEVEVQHLNRENWVKE